ncbi:FkbM family methyltransferase [Flavobacterium sp. ZB4R12]|uniref:FkbM family methyltransferase n=1 Tax=Flavobacterium sp. ZB4R12 TaxID=3398732 RepID=UPI003AACF8ED
MKTNKFFSIIFNLLLKSVKLRDRNIFFRKVWFFVWKYSTKNYDGAVSTIIHGFKVKVNNGYSYPFYARLFPNYNNPLIQLVYSVYELLGRKVSIIDVGSAVGDTNLLLIRNLPNMIETFYCVEGDSEFFKYLNENKSHFPKCKLYNNLLSESDGNVVRNLIKTHLGTASSIGDNNVETLSLDTLLQDTLSNQIDILKIDVDGFDGKILKGSKKIILKFKPLIIFEWHPMMIKNTKNDFHEPFEVLNNLGYNKFLWYTKYGNFSHFSLNDDYLNRIELNKICLRNIHDYDWHYDIIAIHDDSSIDLVKLAELEKAKKKSSRF